MLKKVNHVMSPMLMTNNQHSLVDRRPNALRLSSVTLKAPFPDLDDAKGSVYDLLSGPLAAYAFQAMADGFKSLYGSQFFPELKGVDFQLESNQMDACRVMYIKSQVYQSLLRLNLSKDDIPSLIAGVSPMLARIQNAVLKSSLSDYLNDLSNGSTQQNRLWVLDNAHLHPLPNVFGLRNFGSTCYLNSSLQLLRFMGVEDRLLGFSKPERDRWLNGFDKVHPMQKSSRRIPPESLEKETVRDVKKLIKTRYIDFISSPNHHRMIALYEFVQCMIQDYSRFAPNKHEDASECLMWLMDHLDVAHSHQLTSTLTSKEFQYSSSKVESSAYVSLAMAGPSSPVQLCLENFLTPERLDGDNSLKIQSGAHTDKIATDGLRQFSIQVDGHLIVQIKRFEKKMITNQITGEQRYVATRLSHQLKDIGSCRLGPQEFTLVGAICHTGSLNSGHYRYLEYDSKRDQWYNHDDSQSTEMMVDVVRNDVARNGYVLLYEPAPKIEHLDQVRHAAQSPEVNRHKETIRQPNLPNASVTNGPVVSPAPTGLPIYGGWEERSQKECTKKLGELFGNHRKPGKNQLIPTSTLPYQADLETLQQSVQVHISPGSGITTNDVGTWLIQKQNDAPELSQHIKDNAMDVVLTGSMKQFYDYDKSTPPGSRDLKLAPRGIEFMYNTMPNFQLFGAHYNQIFKSPGHLKVGHEATMKTLFKRSFTSMLHACNAHYQKTKSNGFQSFEFPVQMPNAFFSGFDKVRGRRDLAKRIFAKALQEFLNVNPLPPTCSGVTTIGFGTFSSCVNHANVRHSNANSLHYYDAAKKAGVQCLVPIMGDEHSRMMNGAIGDRAKHAAEENISRQTLGQPAMLLCPVNNRYLADQIKIRRKWCCNTLNMLRPKAKKN